MTIELFHFSVLSAMFLTDLLVLVQPSERNPSTLHEVMCASFNTGSLILLVIRVSGSASCLLLIDNSSAEILVTAYDLCGTQLHVQRHHAGALLIFLSSHGFMERHGSCSTPLDIPAVTDTIFA